MADSVNLDNLYNTEALDDNPRAADAWGMIKDDPTSIVLTRDAAPLATQTVRIEYDSQRSYSGDSAVGRGGQRQCVIFGVFGHPTIADTNIKRADQFTDSNGNKYEVKVVIKKLGSVQAIAEMLGK